MTMWSNNYDKWYRFLPRLRYFPWNFRNRKRTQWKCLEPKQCDYMFPFDRIQWLRAVRKSLIPTHNSPSQTDSIHNYSPNFSNCCRSSIGHIRRWTKDTVRVTFVAVSWIVSNANHTRQRSSAMHESDEANTVWGGMNEMNESTMTVSLCDSPYNEMVLVYYRKRSGFHV